MLRAEEVSLSGCNEVLGSLLRGLIGCESSGDGDPWHPLCLERSSWIENVRLSLSYPLFLHRPHTTSELATLIEFCKPSCSSCPPRVFWGRSQGEWGFPARGEQQLCPMLAPRSGCSPPASPGFEVPPGQPLAQGQHLAKQDVPCATPSVLSHRDTWLQGEGDSELPALGAIGLSSRRKFRFERGTEWAMFL